MVTVLTFRFTLVPAMVVAVEGSTTRVKSWVGRTMKCPLEVAVPPEVLTWSGPVTAPRVPTLLAVVLKVPVPHYKVNEVATDMAVTS